jgi:hypothetical protein
MRKVDGPIVAVAPMCSARTSDGIATDASGNGSVERNPCKRTLTSRWKVKGRTPSSAARRMYATSTSASSGLVCVKSLQSAIRWGMKLKATIHRNPRRGFCVPTNHAPRMGPVHAPTGDKKKPRTKRLATAQATICDRRLALTMVGILRFSFSNTLNEQSWLRVSLPYPSAITHEDWSTI